MSSMKDYDAYLFDWDGTLARTTEIWLTELEFCAEQVGVPITREENARSFGDYDVWRRKGLVGKRYDDFQQMVLGRVTPQLSTVTLFDDALAVLQTLKARGKKLALVTSSRRSSLDAMFAHHQEVASIFDVIVSIEDVHTHKPDPEGINIAIERLGVDKAKTLMLGDTDKDLGAAHNAGIDAVLFYPKEHEMVYDLAELQKLHKPVHVVYAWSTFLEGLQ